MSLARNFLTVGSGTALSRVLGFVRDVMVAAMLGSGAIADAFVVAFRLPNLFRRLLSEGAFNAAFIPIYARIEAEEGAGGVARFGGRVISVLLLGLIALTLLCEIGMGTVVGLLAPGFTKDPEKMMLTVWLSRIAFPFLACATLASVFTGMLNARRRFTVAAFAPVALNVVLCGALGAAGLAGWSGTRIAAVWLCWGVAFGGLVQLAICVIGIRRARVPLKLQRPELDPAVRRLLTLSVPGILASGIAQVNAFVGTIIGSGAPGVVSYLYYADRVYQLPLGIVGVAIGIVLLPDLARRLAAGDVEGAQRAQSRALEFAFFLTLPAAVALAVAARPIVEVLFEHGAFDAAATRESAATLAAFAVGLPGYVIAKALQPAFFAREDMRVPLIIACIGVAADVIIAVALFSSLQHVGIAIAASAAGWINAAALAFILHRRNQLRVGRRTSARMGLTLLASAAMGAALYFGVGTLAPWLTAAQPLAVKAGALVVLCGGGFGVFVFIARLIGAVDPRNLREVLHKA